MSAPQLSALSSQLSGSVRPHDWPARLSSFISAKRRAPFAFGVNDCCLFASDWIFALTGEDPASDLRGTYDSALGAERILAPRGGVAAIAAEVCAARGWPEIPVTRAGRGDLVVIWSERRDILGVCLGAQSAFPGVAGIQYRRTLECVQAWRVL